MSVRHAPTEWVACCQVFRTNVKVCSIMFSFYIFQFFICWKCNPRCVRLSVGLSVSVLIFSRAGEVTLPSSYRSICFHKWSYELQYIYLSLQHKQILDTWQTKYLFQLNEQANLLYSFISFSLSLSLSLQRRSFPLPASCRQNKWFVDYSYASFMLYLHERPFRPFSLDTITYRRFLFPSLEARLQLRRNLNNLLKM